MQSLQSRREATLICLVCSDRVIGISKFLQHLRKHAVSKEVVSCPFENCLFQSSVASSVSAHLSRKHRSAGISELRSDVVVYTGSLSSENVTELETDETGSDSNTLHDNGTANNSWCAGEPDLSPEALIERELLRLFLKMNVVLHVPRYAVQEIIAGIHHVNELSKDMVAQSVSRVLRENSINESLSQTITDCIFEQMPFVKLTDSSSTPAGALSSNKLRDSVAKTTLPYIAPVEYDFGYSGSGKRCTFVYVPILSSIQAQLKRPDILHKVLNPPKSLDTAYRSFLDGSNFKDYRSDASMHIHLTLYTDEWETVNPLGTSRKQHKVNAFYWVFTNIDSQHRSAVHILNLATLARHDDVRFFGFNKYLHPLLADLSFLESNGIYVEALGATIKGTVSCIVSDNLSAHAVGGFTESFGPNVAYPCRFCTASCADIQSVQLIATDFRRRTRCEHDSHVAEVVSSSLSSVFGVKSNCVLHDYLSAFHVTNGLPPDVAHDLLEGIVPMEIALCLGVFIAKDYFSLSWFNCLLKSYPFKFKDAVNKPQRIPDKFAGNGTVGGNATENWTLLRMLPILIGQKVPIDSDEWHLIMELKDIVELCFAPAITEHAIGYLATKITDHKRLFKAVFKTNNFKPKHHFLEHYPDLIREFGPLCKMWTMRFESKHNYFKQVVRECRCFKNILRTMAEKHQLLAAYHLSSHTYFTPAVSVPDAPPLAVTILSDSYQRALQLYFPHAEEVSIVPHVTINGTKYNSGQIVVTGMLSGLPEFSKIVDVMLVSGKVFFVATDERSWFCEHIRGYFLEPTDAVHLIDPYDLVDYYPLSQYVYDNRDCVILKHFICMPW